MRLPGTIAIKRLAYPLYHRARNRETLTVPMFHRVLSRRDPRWESAAPDWTVSDDLFEACLRFFKHNYNVVKLDDLLDSLRHQRVLPERSLLITFDDGYADNAEYALPLLRRYGLPAALFIYSDAIDSRTRPWTEDLHMAYRRGKVSREDFAAIHAALYPDRGKGQVTPDPEAVVSAVVEGANQLSAADTQTIISKLGHRVVFDNASGLPQMLSAAQLRSMVTDGFSIGAHGKTHTALTRARDLDAELRSPRPVIARTLGLESHGSIRTLAFPYGAYDESVRDRALGEGYEILFTIRPEITVLPGRRLTSRVLGRINVHAPTIAPEGRVRYEQLAHLFFRAPHATEATS